MPFFTSKAKLAGAYLKSALGERVAHRPRVRRDLLLVGLDGLLGGGNSDLAQRIRMSAPAAAPAPSDRLPSPLKPATRPGGLKPSPCTEKARSNGPLARLAAEQTLATPRRASRP